jgi:hypothetical protein
LISGKRVKDTSKRGGEEEAGEARERAKDKS